MKMIEKDSPKFRYEDDYCDSTWTVPQAPLGSKPSPRKNPSLTRGRHHCRFCGGIFCRACSKGRCMLPVKFRERNPQRVCDACYDRLDPLQGILISSISNAMQVAKHDVIDWTCSRGWLNLPLGLSMEYEIYKASNTLRSYCQVARLNPDKSIPLAVLKGAKGLAILTVAKAGVLVAYKLGTGLVISRRSDGSWSAPSAIVSVGLGWGAQIGGELMDFIIVLHDLKAVKTFCSRMHFSLGAGCSAAAGPVGRVLEADLRAGDRGSGMCYTYSCSKGAFVGVSLEGNVVATRMDTNLRFYGDPYLTPSDILLGTVDRPKAAEPLYASLEDLFSIRFPDQYQATRYAKAEQAISRAISKMPIAAKPCRDVSHTPLWLSSAWVGECAGEETLIDLSVLQVIGRGFHHFFSRCSIPICVVCYSILSHCIARDLHSVASFGSRTEETEVSPAPKGTLLVSLWVSDCDQTDLAGLRLKYGISLTIVMRVPEQKERVVCPEGDEIAFLRMCYTQEPYFCLLGICGSFYDGSRYLQLSWLPIAGDWC
ncbi:hypothetical protein CJ030_MR6G002446 [Morella rubra]|uniref:FYVE-type domain-containing protein n=1 Tax=Morella rubra TaxID=262757 RepID=A0A6A1V9J7_9ROSI|nr:hypothetical protein CJ030_MR6G002446 [Morella rubra]